MAKPDFLIIGDLKAGTTSLHYYLGQHPDIFMPSQKELRFFAYDKDNPYHRRSPSYRVKNYDEYLGFFSNAKGAKMIGEASPNYLRSSGAANRIKDALPGVKLIVSLRNPADRLHSLYMMHYRGGDTKKSFDEQLFSHDSAWIKSYFYWHDLKRYFDHFGRDQIKVIIFDDLKDRTIDVIRDLYTFLSVDNTFVPNIEIRNKGGMPRNRFLFSMFTNLEKQARKLAYPPPVLRRMWANIKMKSLSNVEIDPLVREKIIEECYEDICRTQDLINRDLTAWFK